jgi:hypothetical protein
MFLKKQFKKITNLAPLTAGKGAEGGVHNLIFSNKYHPLLK